MSDNNTNENETVTDDTITIDSIKATYEKTITEKNKTIETLEKEKARLQAYIATYVSTPKEQVTNVQGGTFNERYANCLRDMENNRS